MQSVSSKLDALLSVEVDIWFSPGQSAPGSMKWPVQLSLFPDLHLPCPSGELPA